MQDFGQAFSLAFHLLWTADADLMEIIGLSLRVSLIAMAVSCAIALPIGAALGMSRFRGRGALIILLLGSSLYAYGAWWWLLPAILAARCVCISFLDYVYHYGTPIDRLLHAYNLELPAPLSAALLNFNLHAVHHRHPNLPWPWLPEAFEADKDRYHADYVRAAARQLRGPIPLPALAAL